MINKGRKLPPSPITLFLIVKKFPKKIEKRSDLHQKNQKIKIKIQKLSNFGGCFTFESTNYK